MARSMASQGGWRPAPTTEPIDAGMPTGGSPDGGERIKPSAPGTIPADGLRIR